MSNIHNDITINKTSVEVQDNSMQCVETSSILGMEPLDNNSKK